MNDRQKLAIEKTIDRRVRTQRNVARQAVHHSESLLIFGDQGGVPDQLLRGAVESHTADDDHVIGLAGILHLQAPGGVAMGMAGSQVRHQGHTP